MGNVIDVMRTKCVYDHVHCYFNGSENASVFVICNSGVTHVTVSDAVMSWLRGCCPEACTFRYEVQSQYAHNICAEWHT